MGVRWGDVNPEVVEGVADGVSGVLGGDEPPDVQSSCVCVFLCV